MAQALLFDFTENLTIYYLVGLTDFLCFPRLASSGSQLTVNRGKTRKAAFRSNHDYLRIYIEKNVSTKYEKKEKNSRFPGEISQQSGQACSQTPACEGQEEAVGLGKISVSVEKKHRLTRSADFQKVYRQGKSIAGRYAVLYYFERANDDESEPRLGISVSKKVGGAVVRNRVKRVLIEAFRARRSEYAPNYDYVIIARPGLADYIEKSQFEEIVGMVAELFQRAKLVQEAD